MKLSYQLFSAPIFQNNYYDKKKELIPALFFIVFIVVGLSLDSIFFANSFFNGRWLMNGFAIIHFCWFFIMASTALRKLMFVMVPLGYLGELLFCEVFDMYTYRMDEIPLYVPFGHAILYATGYVCSKTDWAKRNKDDLREFFITFFALVLLGVGVVLLDVLSLIYGVCFFLAMRRKRWNNFFFFISCWVVVLELFGTFYQCWGWHAVVFGFIPTINPPIGAIFIYVGGDIVLNKITYAMDKSSQKKEITI